MKVTVRHHHFVRKYSTLVVTEIPAITGRDTNKQTKNKFTKRKKSLFISIVIKKLKLVKFFRQFFSLSLSRNFLQVDLHAFLSALPYSSICAESEDFLFRNVCQTLLRFRHILWICMCGLFFIAEFEFLEMALFAFSCYQPATDDNEKQVSYRT